MAKKYLSYGVGDPETMLYPRGPDSHSASSRDNPHPSGSHIFGSGHTVGNSYYPSLISGTGKCIIFTLLFCVAGPCMQASVAAIFSHERPQAVRAGSGCHACLHGPATQKRRGRMMHSARLADKRRKIVFYSLKCR